MRQRTFARHQRRIVFLLAAGAVGAAAIYGAIGQFASGAKAATVPLQATEIPATLPSAGVAINNQIVLQPLTTSPAAMIDAATAVADAREYVNAQVFPATARLASVTFPAIAFSQPDASARFRDDPAWIVTFTSPTPINVGIGVGNLATPPAGGVSNGGAEVLVTHFSIVLDAQTGQFLDGFFTT